MICVLVMALILLPVRLEQEKVQLSRFIYKNSSKDLKIPMRNFYINDV
jgi:hypothetical protein